MADIDRDGNKNFTFGIMKTNCWLVLGMLTVPGAFAQENTNALPPIPAPLIAPSSNEISAPASVLKTNEPARPAKHKRHPALAPKKIAFNEPTVTLVAGPAEVAVKNLNVRGQAGLRGEFLTHLNKGDSVTVLDQINLDKHKAGEPAQWAKIVLPAATRVWVRAQFIDATNQTVLPKKLNLRAGPSENYSVIGVVKRGDPVREIVTKGDWTQIEPPTNAYAFVAAMYLKQESSGTLATNLEPSTETEPMTTNAISEPQPIVTEPTNMSGSEINSPPPAGLETNVPPAEEETNLPPPPPRIVTHEGVVRHVTSLIEPTAYELYDPKSGGEIDYLYTTAPNLDLNRYNNMRIIVTGEEGLVERWNTPMLTIQRILVIDTNAVVPNHVASPRASQSH
jgi:hypothetical protein